MSNIFLQIWDVRTKASVHTLSGHTNAVATVRCQAAEPQIITGMIDTSQVYSIFISEYIMIILFTFTVTCFVLWIQCFCVHLKFIVIRFHFVFISYSLHIRKYVIHSIM